MNVCDLPHYYAKCRRNTRQRLQVFLQRKVNDAVAWAEATGSTFDHDKASLIYFSDKTTTQNVFSDTAKKVFSHSKVIRDPRADKDSTEYPIMLYGKPIQPKQTIKYLGVHLDARLNFQHHVEETTRKATKVVNMLYPITKKLSIFWAQRILTAAVDPIVNYCLAAWWPLVHNNTRISKSFQEVHNMCLRRICGSRMSSPIAALEVELDIPPSDIRRKYLVSCAINRMKIYQNCLTSTHLVGALRAKRAKTPKSTPVPGTIAHLLDLTPEGLAYPANYDLKRYKDSRGWHQQWTSASTEDSTFQPPTGKNLFTMDHTSNPIERLKRYSRLNRAQGRNILHLRIGHTALQEDIMRVYRVTPASTKCRYCEEENTRENADHVLFECSKFETQRLTHLTPLASRDRVELLNNNDGIAAIARFLDKTTLRVVRNKKVPPDKNPNGTGDKSEGNNPELHTQEGSVNTSKQREELI